VLRGVEAQRKAEAEYEGRNHSAILAQKYQWSTWTNPDPSKKLTGQDLLKFLYDDLFPYLRGLQGNSARSVIRGLFEDAPSKMLKDGAILRDAIDTVQEITFESAEDVHTLSHLYESMLAKLGREGGMGGEFYTPRPIIEFVVQMVNPKIGQTVYDPAMGSAGFLVEAYKHMRAAKGNRILPKDEKLLQNETSTARKEGAAVPAWLHEHDPPRRVLLEPAPPQHLGRRRSQVLREGSLRRDPHQSPSAAPSTTASPPTSHTSKATSITFPSTS
jgi:type I restriction enzyme M protein